MAKAAETGAMIALPEQSKIPALFVEGGADELLHAITHRTQEFMAVPRDMNLEADRKNLWNFSREISGVKTKLDDAGKQLIEEAKQKVKVVDGGRKVIRDRLDTLRDEVLAPRAAWEAAEADRIKGHEDEIERINALSVVSHDVTSAELSDRLAQALAIMDGRDWQNFQGVAQDAYKRNLDVLTDALSHAVDRESREKELADLRAREDARRKQDDDARIAQIAADAATQAEADRQKRARDDADAARIKAERDAEDARQQTKDAEEREKQARATALADAQKAADDARLAEEKRQQNIRDAEAAATAKREADKAHRTRIHTEALADLMLADTTNAPISREQARALLIAMAGGKVRHIRVEY